ncbi:putative transcription factor a small subunit [Suhomyces tanzawaensis NRRL Y-17324]|uniref:Transcription initiation factor IIE subunit beta n=1 Tax=Suhomyces tanzawaensis NRRL Y-17324 TaxID=984487 RepID=A0A1E4SBC9_9ASCO|nr:putative transcription factor a small subunit [Suhomyces tanzawaensis NRRL Y-17324]ODV76813.1 putative transcription factor a small subunit [Suhomyces tanzawaensis NRRL Y-17324]
MSDLSAQLSAFKNKIKSGPSVTVARRPVNPIQKPSSPVITKPKIENGGTKRSGPDSLTEAIKRQKVSMGEISGSHLSTQLHLAVEFVKQHDHPVSLAKLQNYLSMDVSHNLLPLLKEIDRLKYDPETSTLEYVSLHNIRNSSDLLNYLWPQPTFKGTSVKELRDGWSGCLAAITELESENKILVLRNKKENAPRLIWANLGGPLGTVDEEFKDMWSTVKLPDNLYQALIDQNLKPTGADPNLLIKKPQQQEKKQKKARRGKITNTHMKGVLKDYSQLV